MIYKDRVTLIRQEVTGQDILGDDIVEEKRIIVPCQVNGLSHDNQMGVFGSCDLNALQIHLQGHHKDFKEIEYDGIKRQVTGKKYHKNSTVVIVK